MASAALLLLRRRTTTTMTTATAAATSALCYSARRSFFIMLSSSSSSLSSLHQQQQHHPHQHQHQHQTLLQQPDTAAASRMILSSRCCWLSSSSRQQQQQDQKQQLSSHSNNNIRYFSDLDSPEPPQQQQQPQQQPFVRARIREGEWDPETRTNPIYRPKFRSAAKIVSAEDFANAPTVGFTNEYESFQDAMITLSWLDQRDQKQIYRLYQEFMENSLKSSSGDGKNGNAGTSHEYVMRVIAQHFNITPERVAGIVELQYNEEQMVRNDPDAVLLTDEADYMDRAIRETIRDAYKTFGLKAPAGFVEDPVGVYGKQDAKRYTDVPDLFDVDKLVEDAAAADHRRARSILDNYVYQEDVDDDTVIVPVNDDCKQLLAAHKEMNSSTKEKARNGESSTMTTTTSKEGDDGSGGDDGDKNVDRRPRWKYIAQIVNTRALKKDRQNRTRNRLRRKSGGSGIGAAGMTAMDVALGAQSRKHRRTARQQISHQSYTNNSPVNTLVELYDVDAGRSTLRQATLAELKGAAWKPVQHVQEHTYKEAKRGWLDRVVRGQTHRWGKQSAAAAAAAKKQAAAAAAADADAAAQEDDEDNNDGSDDSDDDSSSSNDDDDDDDDKDDEADDDDDISSSDSDDDVGTEEQQDKDENEKDHDDDK